MQTQLYQLCDTDNISYRTFMLKAAANGKLSLWGSCNKNFTQLQFDYKQTVNKEMLSVC